MISNRPTLTVVQSPAPTREPWPLPQGVHPDTRLRATIQAARQAGVEEGERQGYTAGWRHGVSQALLGGMAVGALAMYAGLELAAMLRTLP